MLPITDIHRNKRIVYLESFLSLIPRTLITELKTIVWYDEKPLELEKILNRQKVRFWSNNGNDVRRNFIKHKKTTKIHCFVAVSWWGKSDIRWYVNKHTNAQCIIITRVLYYVLYMCASVVLTIKG